jgi:regulator of protease activity HflC (stomatin/prohibitin superfamily)
MNRLKLQSGQSLVGIGCGVAAAIGIVGILAILFSGFNVQPGHVGVVADLSGINKDQQPLTQGFHPVWPFVTHIESASTQPQNHKFARVGTGSKELQNVYIDGGVNYHVNPDAAAKVVIANGGLENGVPTSLISRVFDPAFQDYIKEVVPNYAAADILANRAAIRDAVKTKLAEKASAYGLTVDDLFITNIEFEKDYTKAIEAKQVAAQQLEQAKIAAQTAREKAKGEADALAIQADGDARANQLRARYLTPELIQYLMLAKWNGILPQVTGGGTPFVSVTGK